MKTTQLLLSTLFFAVITSVNAETVFSNKTENSSIVELYTSQGCSSCPPAESWLGKFSDDPRLWKTLFPLAFHVDYWDYIGWKDIYAKAEFSQRQKLYKTEKSIASIYTPGFVVNGQEWRGWFSRTPLPDTRTSGELTATLSNNLLSTTYTNADTGDQELKLNVAILATGIKTEIKRGENSGRTLPQDFTVLHYQAENSPEPSWTMKIPDINTIPEARLALVIWVSKVSSQQPLQVAGNWLE